MALEPTASTLDVMVTVMRMVTLQQVQKAMDTDTDTDTMLTAIAWATTVMVMVMVTATATAMARQMRRWSHRLVKKATTSSHQS